MLKPTPRSSKNDVRSGPCGGFTPGVAGYTAVQGGSLLEVNVIENAGHSGKEWYAIASETATQSVFDLNRIIDNIDDPGGSQGERTVQVRVPNINCAKCTLQWGHTGNWFACADITITCDNAVAETAVNGYQTDSPCVPITQAPTPVPTTPAPTTPAPTTAPPTMAPTTPAPTMANVQNNPADPVPPVNVPAPPLQPDVPSAVSSLVGHSQMWQYAPLSQAGSAQSWASAAGATSASTWQQGQAPFGLPGSAAVTTVLNDPTGGNQFALRATAYLSALPPLTTTDVRVRVLSTAAGGLAAGLPSAVYVNGNLVAQLIGGQKKRSVISEYTVNPALLQTGANVVGLAVDSSLLQSGFDVDFVSMNTPLQLSQAPVQQGNGNGVGSACSTAAQCDDGNSCTRDTCVQGVCSWIVDSALCPDGASSSSSGDGEIPWLYIAVGAGALIVVIALIAGVLYWRHQRSESAAAYSFYGAAGGAPNNNFYTGMGTAGAPPHGNDPYGSFSPAGTSSSMGYGHTPGTMNSAASNYSTEFGRPAPAPPSSSGYGGVPPSFGASSSSGYNTAAPQRYSRGSRNMPGTRRSRASARSSRQLTNRDQWSQMPPPPPTNGW